MRRFDAPAYTMIIHDDLLIEFKVKKNVTLQESHIWETRELASKYMPGKKFVVLMEAEENFDVSVDARRAGASEEYARDVTALALCSNRLHETILGNLFLKVNKPVVTTRFFDDREKAIAWLRSFQK